MDFSSSSPEHRFKDSAAKMRTRWETSFIHDARANQVMLRDSEIALMPRVYSLRERRLGNAKVFTFDVLDAKTGFIAGEISLRFGEGRSLYYLGHVGYHIDPPYRGHGWAARACRLCIPLFTQMNMSSFTITNDPDNYASRKTCEHIGCILESIVGVPADIRKEFRLPAYKCRYICRTDSAE